MLDLKKNYAEIARALTEHKIGAREYNHDQIRYAALKYLKVMPRKNKPRPLKKGPSAVVTPLSAVKDQPEKSVHQPIELIAAKPSKTDLVEESARLVAAGMILSEAALDPKMRAKIARGILAHIQGV